MFWPDRFFISYRAGIYFSAHPGLALGAVCSSVRPFEPGPGLKLATVSRFGGPGPKNSDSSAFGRIHFFISYQAGINFLAQILYFSFAETYFS